MSHFMQAEAREVQNQTYNQVWHASCCSMAYTSLGPGF
jgi:hypothetical protein